jgi:acetyl-CoA/propionyl-CoA carboxylase biotin carboxyl carrier protein
VFRKVLVANRGEIAVRIMRTLREMDVPCVAVFSEADRDALFVHQADEAYHLGPAPSAQSYLNIEAILDCARRSGADAIHPGYGFLAENVPFACAVRDAGLTFIGPSPDAMRLMGDKVTARNAVAPLGVPTVPGTPTPVRSSAEAIDFAQHAGYPVAVKAAGGGGGRGIRVVHTDQEMPAALEAARREAEAYFKNSDVYLERYFPDPRHVEIQILADASGKTIHLAERDCSTQRRHQKLIEETPSPALNRDLRARMGEAAILAARSAGYTSAGTVEFLLTRDGDFFFLEMNTRIQVEHPITERVTGVDLIREMILIAAGEPMSVPESILDPAGHAIEVRINAEDPLVGFRPTPAAVTHYLPPGGPGVRVDGGVYAGYVIPPDYDSLVAKLITWAPDRDRCRRRTLRALDEFIITGPSTTISFSAAVLRHPDFIAGEIGTTFVETHMDELLTAFLPSPDPLGPPQDSTTRDSDRTFDVEVDRKRYTVRVAELRPTRTPERARSKKAHSLPQQGKALTSPMHGTVVAITKSPGDAVNEGEPIIIIEAMKMENEVTAHRSGTLTAINATVGATVETGQQLALID